MATFKLCYLFNLEMKPGSSAVAQRVKNLVLYLLSHGSDPWPNHSGLRIQPTAAAPIQLPCPGNIHKPWVWPKEKRKFNKKIYIKHLEESTAHSQPWINVHCVIIIFIIKISPVSLKTEHSNPLSRWSSPSLSPLFLISFQIIISKSLYFFLYFSLNIDLLETVYHCG